MATQENIGKAIVRLRKSRGVSQEILAAEAGIDRRYMSDLENGKRNISLDVLNRLAAYFEVPLSILIEESEMLQFSNLDSLKEYLVEQGYDDSIVFTGPDYLTAVVGVSEDGRVIYSYDKMVNDLMLSDNLSYEEAAEFIDFNTIRALPYMGEKAPIVMYSIQ